ncbi:MAG: M20/M25/M40 family metallo-hydrolase [Syntrophomonadaceae bacterium]|jgi:tripeptide aminopeptidase|nr:M20/M25/M40 family metallo-hydrolase [Bacillota bacterium]HQD89806.1 M20/M25/M40 family metallo-hydrolase [Syntrophomonadaceae bacterium]
MVNRNRIIDRFVEMVEIDSVSGREGQFKEYLKELLRQRGLIVTEDRAGESLGGNAGNLLAVWPGSAPGTKLLFCAHMDTVEPGTGIKAVVDDKCINSSGETILGADDKAGIAALLEAIDCIREQNLPHSDVELLFTVGEEQGLQGSKFFDYSPLQATMAFVLDGGGEPGEIIIQSPCQNEIEYIAYGKSAHAGINPEDGLNAIHLVSQALAVMPSGRIDEETTCNFGVIEGGTARNIVADVCRVKGECRSLQRTKLDKLTDQLVSTFQDEVAKRGGRAEVQVTFLYPEIQLYEDHPVVQLAIKAAEQAGLQPVLTSTGGGSDASIINGQGIPCVNLGIGMRQVHTTNEYILIDDLVKDAEFVLKIIALATEEA